MPRAFSWLFALALCSLVMSCDNADDSLGFDITLDPLNADYQGYFALKGTVMVPAALPAGKTVTLGLTRGRGEAFGISAISTTGTTKKDATVVRYRARTLAGGTYTIFMWVDLDGDMLISPGDLAGYYDGTTTLPTQDPAAARIKNVDSSETADFGIGPVR